MPPSAGVVTGSWCPARRTVLPFHWSASVRRKLPDERQAHPIYRHVIGARHNSAVIGVHSQEVLELSVMRSIRSFPRHILAAAAVAFLGCVLTISAARADW